MSGQGIVVARRGVGSEVLFRTDVVRLGEVGCVFHRHVEAIALVTPLGWGPSRGGLGVALSWQCETDAAIPFWVNRLRLVGSDPLELAERRFLYIDGIGCNSDGLIGFEPL